MVRGLAALAVMYGHLRALFFVEFRDVHHRSLATDIIYFLTGFGHQAVMVFFVLSGFLISSAIISRRESGSWSWRDYAIDRGTRLYVVLIPGLVLGLLWDKAGDLFFANRHVYSEPLAGFGAFIVERHLTAGAFFGNLFFLQTIRCPTFGSNSPLWSLSNEFWYYVLFPLGIAAAVAWVKRAFGRAIPLTVLSACVAFFVGPRLLSGFLVWLTGSALVLAHSKCRFQTRGSVWIYSVASLLVFALCLTEARIGRWGSFWSDLAVGAACGAFLLAMLRVEFGGAGRYADVAHTLAGFSYSLYLLHFPFLLFLRTWLITGTRWQPDFLHLLCGASLGATAILYAWLTASLTEGNTRAVRGWIKSVIGAGKLEASVPEAERIQIGR